MSNGTSSLGQRLRKLGYPSYAAYLASPHWQNVRKRFYASGLYKGCCEGCKRTDRSLEIHHRTYKRFGSEYLTDLVAVCRDCHQAAHDTEHQGVYLWRATKRALRKRGKAMPS